MTALNTWVSNLSQIKKYLLAFILGALIAAALPPLNLVFLLPVSFTGLLWILSTATTRRQAFLAGWWFGWGQFIAGLYWIGVAFTVDAKTHALLMPLPVLVLPAILAIFSGCATLVTHMSGARSLARVFILSAAWIAFEYVRGVIFTGFAWNTIGYSWSGILPVLQTTAFMGVYGLTLLTVFLSSLPALFGEAETSRRTASLSLAITAGLFAIFYGIGIARIPATAVKTFENATLRIVQPNIPQKDKWKHNLLLEHLRKIVALSLTDDGTSLPRYFIWPETAVPYYLTTTKPLQKELAQIIPPGGAIATGAPRRDPVVRQYWNSLQVLGETGEILDIYDKQHLVPYGEYMPLRSLMAATGLSEIIPALDQMSDFATPDSSAKKVINIPGLPPARALICYEIVFPWEVDPDTPFSWILNITNDGWFGTTSGPYQHFAMTRTRAVEQGVAVVRAANTGISAIIDPYGRVPEELALNETGFIDGDLPLPIPERTLYAHYGEAIPVALVIAFTGIGIGLRRRPSKNARLSS
ncbi:apolipoprotein N-acyltransferase [Sneathiella sp. HT1-7]|jgi:apolipoprotein N-acyltransferase|uniref:apolipoprotein N-acyltransferase n=1 Tax=Sneathiella sp. HT1-7 TaxID=2887192 RepID=UPI001D14F48D|nr:apolipoprotein N-acyltransferase [Sneathiella sp. HT1-7]MCC3303780.1 apolipoprotein N-acyltransferase [Sneathiella sp. HT1-7]